MHYSYIATVQDPVSLIYSNNAISCVQKLDTTTSKYVINKYGVGVSELHWLADPNNSIACPAQIDQMGFVSNSAGQSFNTKFLTAPSPTSTRADQSATCMKTNLN